MVFFLFHFLLEAARGQSFQARGRAASPAGSPMFAWKWLQVVQERIYPWLQGLSYHFCPCGIMAALVWRMVLEWMLLNCGAGEDS